MPKSAYILICLVLVTSLPVLLAACSEDDDCSASARGMMECSIFTVNPQTGLAEAGIIDLVTVTALETDSVIINRKAEAQSLSLPLRYGKEETSLVLHYLNQGKEDTITVLHTNTPYFLTLDCGFQMKQDITSVKHTAHLIDSITISHPDANNYGKENLKIYY